MTGLPEDRMFAVVGPDGATVWQGAEPRMATIRARCAGATLVLGAPDVEDLTVEVVTDAARSVEVDVEKWPGVGIDQGDDAARWLGELLGRPVRLVREPARTACTA